MSQEDQKTPNLTMKQELAIERIIAEVSEQQTRCWWMTKEEFREILTERLREMIVPIHETREAEVEHAKELFRMAIAERNKREAENNARELADWQKVAEANAREINRLRAAVHVWQDLAERKLQAERISNIAKDTGATACGQLAGGRRYTD